MPISTPSDRERIKMLTTMNGISNTQQDTLWHLALDVGPEEAEEYTKSLIERGATYKYTMTEVEQVLGPRKSFIGLLLERLFGS